MILHVVQLFLGLLVATTVAQVVPMEMTFHPEMVKAAALLTNGSHYEDPKPNGCRSDEEAIQITGVSGDFCTPECIGTTCPTDVPPGCQATPTCALQDTSGTKFCALMCNPGSDDAQCGPNASCKPIASVGICTYDD